MFHFDRFTKFQRLAFGLGLLFVPTATALGQELATTNSTQQTSSANLTLVEHSKIWDQSPHNAFTDLLFFDNHWYCVFREGARHVSPDGAIRVIVSEDGKEWSSLALITNPEFDLRDAKLSVTPNGELLLNGAGMQAEEKVRYHSMVWTSNDAGKSWSDGKTIGEPGDWLWRVQWHQGAAYSMGYGTDRDQSKRGLRFYKSDDGLDYQTVIEKVNVPNGVGEDKILFIENEQAICLLRNESGDKRALLGRATAPFLEWKWQELDQPIGGPNMLQLPNGRIIAAARLYQPKMRTALLWLDPDAGTMTECLTLPSGGDTSYPGMVYRDGFLWVSYYSSHEGKANIYFAKVKIDSNSK